MSIGINLHCCGDEISLDEQLELMKETGFTRTFCFADLADVDTIIAKTQEVGMEFESLHAKLGDINNIWKTDASGDEILQSLCDNVDTCKKFGIPVLVVHMSAGRPAPDINDAGCARYDALMQHAREQGVKIAFENSRAVANLAYALEKYEDAGFCWDVGHETCFTPGMDYMPYFGNALAAVHIHDNMGKLDKDWHMIPFDGVINMEKVADELAKVQYQKCIMLELIKNRFGIYSDITPKEFFCRAADAAKRLERMVDQKRQGTEHR